VALKVAQAVGIFTVFQLRTDKNVCYT